MDGKLLFSFEEMGSQKDAATKKLVRQFALVHRPIVQGEVLPQIKRTSGVSYREMVLTFADSQKVTMRIKQSGDIFQVLLNDRIIPIKNQDDHVKAVVEIVDRLDAGAAKFQKQLAVIQAKLPAGIRTAAPKLEQVLTEKRDSLKEAISHIKEEIAKLTNARNYVAAAQSSNSPRA